MQGNTALQAQEVPVVPILLPVRIGQSQGVVSMKGLTSFGH